MRTIREAILMAADKIESDPACYNFHSGDISGDGPGCLIVWACRFAGHSAGKVLSRSSPLGFGHSDLTDYVVRTRFCHRVKVNDAPTRCAAAGAALLRDFADARYPATPRRIDTVPDWRAIAEGALSGDKQTATGEAS